MTKRKKLVARSKNKYNLICVLKIAIAIENMPNKQAVIIIQALTDAYDDAVTQNNLEVCSRQ